MQNLVNRIEGQIANNPRRITGVLEDWEYQALKAGGPEANRIYGQAIERMAAEQVRADPVLSDLFSTWGRSRIR